jgi:hypothetical protein
MYLRALALKTFHHMSVNPRGFPTGHLARTEDRVAYSAGPDLMFWQFAVCRRVIGVYNPFNEHTICGVAVISDMRAGLSVLRKIERLGNLVCAYELSC